MTVEMDELSLEMDEMQTKICQFIKGEWPIISNTI